MLDFIEKCQGGCTLSFYEHLEVDSGGDICQVLSYDISCEVVNLFFFTNEYNCST